MRILEGMKMELKLSHDEVIVKSWEYGVLKGLFVTHGKFTLAVTNKRLISIYESKDETSRDEYDLNQIKSVSASYKFYGYLFFFKRGSLDLSLVTSPFKVISVVGLNAISSKPNILARIPIIGFLFRGKKDKVKVYVKEAKDIVENISSLIMNTTNVGE